MKIIDSIQVLTASDEEAAQWIEDIRWAAQRSRRLAKSARPTSDHAARAERFDALAARLSAPAANVAVSPKRERIA